MKFRYFLLPFLLTFTLLFISCGSEETVTPDVPPIEQDTEEQEEEEEPTWQLVWEDEFDGDELNMDKWSFQLGDGCHISQDLCGWGNRELQYYTEREENISLEDGFLTITAKKEDYEGSDYTSARIRTIDKGDWQYGRLEIRAKLPQGQGIWPAIWMLPTGENLEWPQTGEIDIMEMVGHEPETVHGTVHYGDPWPENKNKGQAFLLDSGIFADDYHVFSIEWEVNKIQWFVDDKLFFTVTPNTLTPYAYPFNSNRFHLIMNIAVGGIWPGNPDSTTEFPQTMSVDYVRVYQFK